MNTDQKCRKCHQGLESYGTLKEGSKIFRTFKCATKVTYVEGEEKDCSGPVYVDYGKSS